MLNLEGRLRLQQGFISDRNALAQAVNAATEPVTPGSAVAVNQPEQQLIHVVQTGTDSSGKAVSARDRSLSQALLSALGDSGRIAQDQHIQPYLAGLLALAQSQRQIAQRSAVIFFTSFHNKQLDSHAKDAIKSIVGTANQAGVSIYVVDVASVDAAGKEINATSASLAAAATCRKPPTNFGNTINAMNITAFSGFMSTDDNSADDNDMKALAEATGGSYITKDRFGKSLEQLINDMTTYYQASFLPATKEFDGSFHPIAVKPLRAGLKIRSQTGYLAMPRPVAGASASAQPFEMPLEKILVNRLFPAI